jgi:hypothetical protein
MKRLLLVIVLFVGGLNSFCAGVIPMQIIDPGSMGSSGTYAPPRPWYITQDDHVLTLPHSKMTSPLNFVMRTM